MDVIKKSLESNTAVAVLDSELSLIEDFPKLRLLTIRTAFGTVDRLLNSGVGECVSLATGSKGKVPRPDLVIMQGLSLGPITTPSNTEDH